MLWRDLRALQVYGANTDVGKTIVSTILCKALQRRAPGSGLLYLKPVSTGPAEEADDRYEYVSDLTLVHGLTQDAAKDISLALCPVSTRNASLSLQTLSART